MDQQSDKKGCLIRDHMNPQIFQFCMDKDCQEESRTMCPECIAQKNDIHPNCQSFLIFKDFLNSKLQFFNQKDNNCYELFNFLDLSQESLSNQIDKVYDDLLKSITEKLQELKKKQKLEIMESLLKAKQTYNNIIERQKNLKNLSNIEENLVKFNTNQLSLQQLNQILKQKQQQNFSNQEKETLKTEIDQKIDSQELKFLETKQLQSQTQFLLDNINKFSIFKTNFQYLSYFQEKRCCNYPINIEMIGQQKHKRKENHYPFILTSKSFKTDQKIKVNFKLHNVLPPSFFVAIQQISSSVDDEFEYDNNSQYQFSPSNHCINIATNQNQNYYFEITGVQDLQQIYKEGQIYEVSVCIKENIFKIQDQNKECCLQHSRNQLFPSSNQANKNSKWCILIGDNYNNGGLFGNNNTNSQNLIQVEIL